MLRLFCTIFAATFVAAAAPSSLRADESPGAMLDEGLERLNRAFDELSGRAAGLSQGIDGHAVYVIDDQRTVWCPSGVVMGMILNLSPTDARIGDNGVLDLRSGEGRLMIQPGAGCVLTE